MRASHPDEVRSLLRNALDALKRGDKNAARSLADQAASLAPRSEEPLLVLAALTSPEVSLAYVKQALRINPESRPAQQALEWALKRRHDQSAAPEDDPEDDLFEIGPLLYAKLASLADSVLEPDPLPKPIQLPTSPAIPAETLPEPAPPSEPIQPPAIPAVPTPAPAMPEPQAEAIDRAAGPTVPGVPSSPAPKPSPPDTARKKFSLPPARALVLSLLGLGALVFVGFLAFWFGGPLLERLSQGEQPVQPAPAFPTIIVPTPDCGPPTLLLGTATFQIQTMARAADGSISIPENTPDVVYWVDESSPNHVFALSNAPQNLALKDNLKDGDLTTITWEDCTAQSYIISDRQTSTFNPGLLDPSQADLTLLIPGNSTDEFLVLHGVEEQAEYQEYEILTPRPEDLLISVTMERVLAPEDSQTVQVEVTIKNYGVSSITIKESDVGLFIEEGTHLAGLSNSNPELPYVLQPGNEDKFNFIFTRLVDGLGTLRIFNIEYSLEDFQ